MNGTIALIIMTALSATQLCAAPTKIVCLGDSITKGVRGGVTEADTFEALLQEALTEGAAPVEVINVGIGGERTDLAIARLATDVVAKKPHIVTIMYGTNDSAVDQGKTEPRLPLATYRTNLRAMVDRLRGAGIRPVLMTSPPLGRQFAYMNWAPYRDEGANCRIIDYVRAVRAVAADTGAPLVDNFATWAELALMGTDIDTLMTDGCHPNPAGHRVIAWTMYPVLARMLGADATPPEGLLPGSPPTLDETPAPAESAGNLALNRPYTETSHNTFGYDKGLTDGIITSDTRGGVYATGLDEEYPKVTTVDLGSARNVGRIVVRNSKDGNTRKITLEVSADGAEFTQVGEHEFQQADGAVYECRFDPLQAQYVRLSFLDSWLVDCHGSQHFMFVRELEVFAE